ncbi:DUF402 domain-containing protein [Bacillus sp. KH172YL63]|uniref:DUF402 domain-containing protein n=1 Tax=Bacillus sp. KH172YL63 TaxID=2709784 RepID=UPI0013E4F4E2|nr:DUF402 domain-containing protein [Bacillus sp. KH172YL63]BCB05221.1 UPF0374 protein [Bacillus sp. KH172YL63]
MSQIIHITSLKYPDSLHYEWEGELVWKTSNYVMVLCKAGRKLIHHTKNTTFTIDVTSLEFFSLKEGFTAAMEIRDGSIVSYYCNVASPAVLRGNELSYVDLDLDLIKRENEHWQVIDEEEFEINSLKYNYPLELKEGAIRSLEKLLSKVRKKEFPFSEDVLESLRPKHSNLLSHEPLGK